jgi:hypothetical protein
MAWSGAVQKQVVDPLVREVDWRFGPGEKVVFSIQVRCNMISSSSSSS